MADRDAEPRAPTRTVPLRGAARLLFGAPLDPNREPADVLALLPGLGPARAAALVAARPLCGLEDVDRVPGIGPVTLRTLAPKLAFRALPRDCEQELRGDWD